MSLHNMISIINRTGKFPHWVLTNKNFPTTADIILSTHYVVNKIKHLESVTNIFNGCITILFFLKSHVVPCGDKNAKFNEVFFLRPVLRVTLPQKRARACRRG